MAVVSHAGQHANANDAIEAIETELGTNPSGASATVKDRLDTLAVGPGSATDNALVRFDGTTGKVVQNSGITVDDSGYMNASRVGIGTAPSFPLHIVGGNNSMRFSNGGSGVTPNLSLGTSGGKSCGLLAGSTGTAFVFDSSGTFNVTYDTKANIDGGLSSGGTAALTVLATGVVRLPQPGATAGLELGASGPRVMSGTGSPEGVVTAPVGSTWIDTAATTGAIKWIKASGTGNTGWVVEYGDTGWRQMSADLLNSWAFGIEGVKIRRVGTHVVVLLSCSGASASSDTLLNVPSGFRTNTRVNTTVNDGSSTVFYAEVRDAHTILCGSRAAVVRGTFSYFTNDAWPSSLPGSAA